jgi:small-conductance mechanosensitive channel
MLIKLTEYFHKSLGLSPEIQSKFFTSIIFILVLWFLHRLILRIVLPRIKELSNRYRWKKTSGYVAAFLGIVIIGWIWFEGIQSIATFLGLLSAGIAIALKDLVANLAGWVFIMWRRPFEVGDRVQIGNDAGDVIDLRIFQFTLMEIGNWVEADQSTGRIIHIPNGKVFTESLANYHKGFRYIWNEIPVLITFESNWMQAKEILQQIGSRHAEHLSKSAEERIIEASRRFMIFYSKLTPSVYTNVKDSGVLLTLRYLCEPRRRRDSQQAIWEDVLTEFAKCPDIDFAYPTQRFFNNLLEGKSRTKVPLDKKESWEQRDKDEEEPDPDKLRR